MVFTLKRDHADPGVECRKRCRESKRMLVRNDPDFKFQLRWKPQDGLNKIGGIAARPGGRTVFVRTCEIMMRGAGGKNVQADRPAREARPCTVRAR